MAKPAARNARFVWLTDQCLKNPIAVVLFYVAVACAGAAAFFAMGRSILPPVSLPIVAISAPYPGAAPKEIERLVIEPIEEQLRGTADLWRVTATAQNGIGELTLEFRFGSPADADRAGVQQAVDAARPNLPADLLPPSVSTGDPGQAPVLEESVSSVLLSAPALADAVTRRVLPRLRSERGIGLVRASGDTARQFTVVPSAGRLQAVRATVLDVFRGVAAGNALLPGGTVRSGPLQSSLGIDASAASVGQLEALPLAVAGSPALRVRDVASVVDGRADPATIDRVDGSPAIAVYVSPASGTAANTAIAAARKTFAELNAAFPEIRFEEVHSDAGATAAAIGGVLQTLGEGLALTVVVLLLFLHAWRNASIAAISIPASICAALATMWFLGLTLNVLSLMGLSLTIGILVDDSIVIIEAIAGCAARGLRGDEAALTGRRELGGATVAITLVDVAVFAPIALMNGVVGEFMREFGLAVVLATSFSLLVSFTLTPLLCARWALVRGGAPLRFSGVRGAYAALKGRSRTFPWTYRTRPVLAVFATWHAALEAFNGAERRIARRYAREWLPVAARFRRSILACAVLACAASFVPFAVGWIPTEFSPPAGRGEVRATLALQAGTPLARTDAVAQRVAAVLLKDPSVDHVQTVAGRAASNGGDVFAQNVADVTVVTADPAGNGSAAMAELRSAGRRIAGAAIIGGGKGMGGVPTVGYTISGDSASVDAAAARVAAALRRNPYATDVQTSNDGLQPRDELQVDAGAARVLDLSPEDAAQTARIAAGGSLAMRARTPSGLVDVVVRGDAARTRGIEALRTFQVRSGDGVLVPLADVLRTHRTQEPVLLQREDGRRIVTVSANARDGVPIGMVSAPIARALRDPNFLPPGARLEARGDLEQFFDAVSKIGTALAAAMLAVYAILAVLYRSYALPLVIMLTVPLAAIGALGTLFTLNLLRNAFPHAEILQAQTLNLYSMLGIVMLVGLVAKNGILLVEYAERAVRRGVPAFEAMQSAAERRFRPIVMTTCAMIAGMAPLALGHTIGAEYRKALGTVVIGGLSSSLLLTLFVVPLVYVVYRERSSRLRAAA